ncbi:MAG: hypothetical protein C4291_15195, partial [Candidatus Dadabacteria bacterium]
KNLLDLLRGKANDQNQLKVVATMLKALRGVAATTGAVYQGDAIGARVTVSGGLIGTAGTSLDMVLNLKAGQVSVFNGPPSRRITR